MIQGLAGALMPLRGQREATGEILLSIKRFEFPKPIAVLGIYVLVYICGYVSEYVSW